VTGAFDFSATTSEQYRAEGAAEPHPAPNSTSIEIIKVFDRVGGREWAVHKDSVLFRESRGPHCRMRLKDALRDGELVGLIICKTAVR
jgi:hypothetical protein